MFRHSVREAVDSIVLMLVSALTQRASDSKDNATSSGPPSRFPSLVASSLRVDVLRRLDSSIK